MLFFGAGLPQVVALAGEAKPYAERLLCYHRLGPLPPEDARAALRQPLEDGGVSIGDDALNEIKPHSAGRPFCLQVWGFQCWNVAQGTQITVGDVLKARAEVTRHLDAIFRVEAVRC